MDGIVLLLVLGAIAACAYLIVENRSGVESATVRRSPEEIISLSVAQIPTGTASLRSSWMPGGHTDRSATFVYKRRPSVLLALFLLLFFLVPGILYLIFGGKNQTVQVSVLPGQSGDNVVQVASSGGVARRRARAFLHSLAVGEQAPPAGAAMAPSKAALPSTSPAQPVDEHALAAPVAAVDGEPVPESATLGGKEHLRCEHCSGELRKGDRFCPSCGKPPTEEMAAGV